MLNILTLLCTEQKCVRNTQFQKLSAIQNWYNTSGQIHGLVSFLADQLLIQIKQVKD